LTEVDDKCTFCLLPPYKGILATYDYKSLEVKTMNKKLGIGALLVAGILLSSGVVYAFNGQGFFNNENIQQALGNGDYEAWKQAMTEEMTQERFQQMSQNYQQMQERQQYMEQVQVAIEAGDYNAWKSAMEQVQRPQMTDVITEENFDTFVAIHNAMQNGDYETANQLREQLGIDMDFGMKNQFRHGFMNHFGNCPGMDETFGSGSAL
jgi:hypothetical protein